MESLSPVNSNGGVTTVSAGAYHTCAVMTDGNVKCWGLNEYGQLGYDNTENIGDQSGEMESLSPVNLNGTATSVFASDSLYLQYL